MKSQKGSLPCHSIPRGVHSMVSTSRLVLLIVFLAEIATSSAWNLHSLIVRPRARPSASLVSCASSFNNSEPSSSHSSTRESSFSLPKPMGLILEEFDDRPGTKLIGLQGAALEASRRGDIDICLNDELVCIQGEDCHDWTLDHVMEAIQDCTEKIVQVTMRRPHSTVAVRFQRPNGRREGVGVAATPGEHLCNVALQAQAQISYSCRNGACGTCEQIMKIVGSPSEKARYVRPCVALVPSGMGADSFLLLPSDRYE